MNRTNALSKIRKQCLYGYLRPIGTSGDRQIWYMSEWYCIDSVETAELISIGYGVSISYNGTPEYIGLRYEAESGDYEQTVDTIDNGRVTITTAEEIIERLRQFAGRIGYKIKKKGS